MRKSKEQKAITLIALIITIVVLLILAAVAISSITNDGILSYAENAAKDYNQAVKNEQDMLNEYVNFLNNGGSGGTAKTVETVKNMVLSTTSNTDVYDAYGNKIVVPAGFKIRVDSTTNNADTVTEGIVIEHGTDENQFVWIPVGKIYTDTAKTESLAKTITLGRYDNFTATNGVYTPATTISDYTEETKTATGLGVKGNAIARDIESFLTSANPETGNGGYYLGRYEAGDSKHTTVASRSGTNGTSTAGTLVCKANQVPYNWIKQPDASSKCKSMYADGYKNNGTGTFSSDLINSYAWDTAIVFIQTFGTKTNSATYANTIGKSSTDTNVPQLTGVNRLANVTDNPIDEQLNIYDMAGNCWEWTTESSSASGGPCVCRGGRYGSGSYDTRFRLGCITSDSRARCAFRPLLYVGL